LVIVRVIPFEEYQSPRGVDQLFRLRILFEITRHFARRRHPVAAYFRKNLFDGARARRLEGQRFEQIDLDVFSAPLVAAKERKEGGGLQQQESAGFIVIAVLIGVMERVGRSDRVQRYDAWASHQQFSRAEEKGVPDGLWGDAAIELADHFIACLFVGSFAQD